MPAGYTIVVEPTSDGRYRATSPLFPDAEVTAASEEEARRRFAVAAGDLIEQQRQAGAPESRPADL